MRWWRKAWYWLSAADPALDPDVRFQRQVGVLTVVAFIWSAVTGLVGWALSHPAFGVLVGLAIWIGGLYILLARKGWGANASANSSTEPRQEGTTPQLEKAAIEAGLPVDAKTRQEFVECHFRLIDLLKLAGEDSTIKDKTFRDCIIEGPAAITRKHKPPEGDSPRHRGVLARATVKQHDTSYIYGEPDSIFYEVPVGGENASGVIRLAGCDFIGTKFRDIAVVGTEEELKDWKDEFNYRGKYDE